MSSWSLPPRRFKQRDTVANPPRIAFEVFRRYEDDPEPYRAHIYAATSDHHGLGSSPAEALMNAATHWFAWEKDNVHTRESCVRLPEAKSER